VIVEPERMKIFGTNLDSEGRDFGRGMGECNRVAAGDRKEGGSVTTDIRKGRLWGVGLIAALAVLLALSGVRPASAQDAGASPPKKMRRHRKAAAAMMAPAPAPVADPPSAEDRLDALSADVTNLRKSDSDNGSAIAVVQKAITVVTPSASATPATIGEHVGALERDLTDTRTNIANNLGVHIHGLVDATYEYNANDPQTGIQKGGNTGPGGLQQNQFRAFDVDSNSFELQQFNFHLDKTADGGVGFVADINFGKTAEVLEASTRYSNSSNTGASSPFSEVDPTQAYLTYTVPVGSGINLSAGKFVTLLGEEVIPVYNNTNYNESRGLVFTLGEPLTHTGIRAQYTFNSQFGATLGVNNGWDDVSDGNSGKTVEGQLAWTPIDAFSATVSGTYGNEQVNEGGSKLAAVDPIATWKTPIPNVTLVGEYLYAYEVGPITPVSVITYDSEGNSLPGSLDAKGQYQPHADWQGAAGYVIWDVTPAFEFATRGEYFRDSTGVRTGIRQSLAEVTETLNYKIPAVTGLLARLEYRHDESNAKPFLGDHPFDPTTGTVVTRAGQDTVEAAAVYSF
jgi:hypothetical protein